MRTNRFFFTVFFGVISASAFSQAWIKPYEAGLRASNSSIWSDAKARFEEAAKLRSDDTDKASQMGDSVADKKPWRNGAPYSPNFGIAYANFKLASEATDKQARTDLLNAAIAGFDKLLQKGQESFEALLFLTAALSANNETKRANDLQGRIGQLQAEKAFKIDREILDPNDLRAVVGAATPAGTTGGDNRGGAINAIPTPGVGSRGGLVPALDHKYAIIVGVTVNGGPIFGEDDADMMRDALVKHAGYAEDHIVVLKNPTTEALKTAVDTTAGKIPDSGTVLFFYTGRGVHDPTSGKDYIATADSPEIPDVTKMVSKLGLFQPFVMRGAAVFSFFQVDRPMDKVGRYFGMDVPQVGRISQCQSNSPGEKAYGTVVEGKVQGVYAWAACQVLSEMRDNRIPISDFAWNVFYKIRKGSVDGGGGAQTPTLPVVVSMTTSARF